MISAYISTDIIIVNRNTRLDDVTKILSIICNSLDEMKILGIPYLLKNIWVQIEDEDEKEEIENRLKVSEFNDRRVKIDTILIESFNKCTLKKVGGNILEVKDYLKQVKTAFEKILDRSISNPFQYINNFNNILNKIDIKEEVKKILKIYIQELRRGKKKIYYKIIR